MRPHERSALLQSPNPNRTAPMFPPPGHRMSRRKVDDCDDDDDDVDAGMQGALHPPPPGSRCSTMCCTATRSASLCMWVLLTTSALLAITLASLWQHMYGVAGGTVSFALGLTGLVVFKNHPPASSYVRVPSPRLATTTTTTQPTGKRYLRGMVVAMRFVLVVYCLLLAAIHLAEPNPDWTAFPTRCPSESENCVRVAGNTSYRADGMVPPVKDASVTDVRSALQRWLNAQPLTVVLASDVHVSASGRASSVFMHARLLSDFWGFADDVGIHVWCEGEKSVVYVQSMARLGRKDFGANTRHVRGVVDFVEAVDVPLSFCGD